MNDDQLQQMLGGPVRFGKPLRVQDHRWYSRAKVERHLWCATCTRTFPNGLVREHHGRATCPYVDCPGEIGSQAHAWSSVRSRHPNYPQHPNMWVQYVCPPWSTPYRHPGSTAQMTTALAQRAR